MSGTSLDGLDLVAVEFEFVDTKWSFKLNSAKTNLYTDEWIKKLKAAPALSGVNLLKLHNEYGRFIGSEIKRFITATGFQPDIIASHGHTVFHQPENWLTFQLGNGLEIAAQAGIKTISDFRSGDVALGGQGAPLVPIGDRLLFSEFDYCLNLGGFANISFEKGDKTIAYDICPANFILNYLAEKKGLAYDRDGEIGKKGEINFSLLKILDNIGFYQKLPPKSLGREWMENSFFPILNKENISDTDKMRTIYEHIAGQISKSVSGMGKVLVTGGGAFNKFLIGLISEKTSAQIFIPPTEIINFKEAIIFAFLGVLRVLGINNCLSSVTGASADSCTGVICSKE